MNLDEMEKNIDELSFEELLDANEVAYQRYIIHYYGPCHEQYERQRDAFRARILRMYAEKDELILQFVASYTLADHLGDVSDDVDVLLKKIGFNEEWDDEMELCDLLAKKGITTLYGTSLEVYDDD